MYLNLEYNVNDMLNLVYKCHSPFIAQAKKYPKSFTPVLGRTANKITPIKEMILDTAAAKYN